MLYLRETFGPGSLVYLTLGDKKWLETHLWHAKRMHMENMWGYRLVSITVESASVNSSL
jgi:hypothetical protein